MTVRLVLDPEVDPFVFQQPLDEVQVGFLELHAVLAHVIRTFQLEAVVGAPMSLKHLLNDLRHRQVLEDPAVLVLFQKRQPASQFQRIGVLAAQLTGVVATEHVGAEGPYRPVAQIDVSRQ